MVHFSKLVLTLFILHLISLVVVLTYVCILFTISVGRLLMRSVEGTCCPPLHTRVNIDIVIHANLQMILIGKYQIHWSNRSHIRLTMRKRNTLWRCACVVTRSSTLYLIRRAYLIAITDRRRTKGEKSNRTMCEIIYFIYNRWKI